jgi:hypothetical protein
VSALRSGGSALLALAVLGGSFGDAVAQGYRGWASTAFQVVEMRPLGADTVLRSDVVTDAEGRFLYNGIEVSCVLTTVCTGYLPLDDEHTLAATQDLGLTMWGLGVQGLSVTAHVRARARAGGDLVWPRSDDEFDAIMAYAQLQRGALRVRLGRMDIQSGLGFAGFDGASASYTRGIVRGELYGGRSLARGLREPAQEAFQGLDDFFLDHGVLLFGGSASGRLLGTAVTARYQREILWDRSSLVSERGSLDFSGARGRFRLRGAFDYDFAREQVGKAELTWSMPFRESRWLVELSARRYVPYFDLSTIWGFFEPVSYSELSARVGWSRSGDLAAWISGGRRSYADTETAVILEPMRDVGWRADLGARWRLAPQWVLDGQYRLEWGPGGFLSSADASGRFSVTERITASLSALTFQQIEEYRLGQGRAFGGGASIDVAWNERISIGGGASVIRHRDGGNVFTSPWSQTRAWMMLRLDIGGDPGLAPTETAP